ncbi:MULTISPECIES: IS481 family transposase [unclassified Streptomyces]|uniref:IS481 family transposase n=1 Tax=unclassified Streptomyces TaxID=2593676 RepID=UPI002256B6EC|nr:MULTISPECIES: IS481 family transposase [unclassified Streptomyces]MCX5054473.1 IS481 family transposase [Streptomyces sp. NBC_00474]MCX5063624.1 IS481 family transposase [Streptomyces sp. NBC_00452]
MAGHPNAPLTPEGRRRLCERVDAGRPIAHVAAEAGISRRCLAKWYARWRAHGENGLLDHSSRPNHSPTRTSEPLADLVEALRRQTKHGPARLAADLKRLHGVTVALATVHRILVRRGLNRLRDLDPPTGEQLREVIRYEHERAGDLVHVDVKKLGRIPEGGGWRMHGVGTDAARASKRTGPGTGKVGYTYLHSALDDHSRLAYTEALDDEKAVTAVAFWHRAVAFFAAHGITPIRRCLTDNGSCYRSTTWANALSATGTKHKRTRPYTPRTNGKVERYNGTLAREWAYVRNYSSEHECRVALAEFVNYYNHDRPHAALGGRPPISRTAGSDYRLVLDQPPEPLIDIPQQLTFEDVV